ncbi:MAG: RrF2 family transcriptional regulator, partial [Gemmatimonadaceae bacterium]
MPTDKPVLTKTAEHALRALLVLAHCGRGKPLASAAIAELTGAPANYLGKTLLALARAGLVRSCRGRTGGFELAVPAEAITVARIADVFAEPLAARQCLLGTGRC